MTLSPRLETVLLIQKVVSKIKSYPPRPQFNRGLFLRLMEVDDALMLWVPGLQWVM